MKVEVTLPNLGEDAVAEVTISAWLANVGDVLEEGDDLIELTTDKAAFSLPCPQRGTLRERCVNEGQDVKVGEVIAVLDV